MESKQYDRHKEAGKLEKIGCLAVKQLAGELDVVEMFAKKFSGKFGTTERQEAAYIVASLFVLEVAEHVFNLGKGVSSFSITGFQLTKLKHELETINKKIDILLNEPLKMAIQKFENALKLIECRMFKKANEDLEKVIDSAEKALRFMEAKRNNEKRIPLEVFKECMNAQKMILFSKILINSYDDKKNTYLPYFAMPENESNYLESETQDIADKSMKMMRHLNVMERTWILTKSVNIQRKDEAQDCLDKILKGAYPYISRRNKWTQVGTEIDPDAETQWITVMPRYVPVGIEDKVKLVIGVVTKDGDPRGFVCIHIWREDLCIYVEHGDKRTAWIFDAAFGKMKVNVLLDRKHLNVFEDDYNQGENARNYAKEKNHVVERKGFVASDAKREFHTLISSFQG